VRFRALGFFGLGQLEPERRFVLEQPLCPLPRAGATTQKKFESILQPKGQVHHRKVIIDTAVATAGAHEACLNWFRGGKTSNLLASFWSWDVID
jgi:hypothetical protein